MFTMFANSTRLAATTAAAVAIVSFGALAMDQSYIASAPRGTVEVGELTLVDSTAMTPVMLPEVTVVAKRESADTFFAVATQLPEVVVVAKRVAYMVAKANAAEQGRTASVQGPAEGALLK
ncbi:MAG: hypothetical protein WBO00_08230 [Steroidobacteraceae bacterium]